MMIVENPAKVTNGMISRDAWILKDVLAMNGIDGFKRNNELREDTYNTKYFVAIHKNGFEHLYPRGDHEFVDEYLKVFNFDLTIKGETVKVSTNNMVTPFAKQFSNMLNKLDNFGIALNQSGKHLYNSEFFYVKNKTIRNDNRYSRNCIRQS